MAEIKKMATNEYTLDIDCLGPVWFGTWIMSARKFGEKVFNFIHSIDPTIKVRISHEEFYAESENNLINISLDTDEVGDELICRFVKERLGVTINPFLLGCLHEVGHIMTFDKQLDRERSIIYYLLDLDFKMEEFEAYSYMYFQIPSEFEATKWAVNYYLSHKEFCDNFLKEIGYAA